MRLEAGPAAVEEVEADAPGLAAGGMPQQAAGLLEPAAWRMPRQAGGLPGEAGALLEPAGGLLQRVPPVGG